MVCSLALLAPKGPIFESLFPVPVGLLPIIPPSYGSLAADFGLRFPLGEIGAERLTQAMAAGFALACGLRIISLPSAHGQVYTGGAFGVKCEGPELAWILPLWQGPRAMREGYISRLRAPI